MFDMSINWLLVTGLSLGAWVLGFLWFVLIFGRAYMAGHGRTKTQLDSGPSMPVASFYQLIGAFVQVGVLAWVIKQIGVTTMAEGAAVGALVWLGFIVAYIAPMYAFQAYSLRYGTIVMGYPFVVLVVAGAILGAA